MTRRGRPLRDQGAYYVLTGVSPFVSRRLFEVLTGRKREFWLVETVGALATAIGSALLVAARREEPSPEALTLAVGSAASFAAIDVVYVARRRIAPTYLVDAVAQVLLIARVVRSEQARRSQSENGTSAVG